MEDRCVCCGVIIPEGRQICYQCEFKVDEAKKAIVTLAIKNYFRKYLETLLRVPKDGRDPLTKRYILYISKILGKSNNWRKMHGIPMTRR